MQEMSHFCSSKDYGKEATRLVHLLVKERMREHGKREDDNKTRSASSPAHTFSSQNSLNIFCSHDSLLFKYGCSGPGENIQILKRSLQPCSGAHDETTHQVTSQFSSS